MTQDFKEPVFFRNRVKFIVSPDVNGDTIIPTITTPNVANRTVFICLNTGSVTVTNFLGGSNFQSLKLLGDGFTTIKNNSTIKTNSGSDKLLAVNKAYNFTNFNGVWIEDAD